jgi:F0F1-type ATP synthase membrane subunit a
LLKTTLWLLVGIVLTVISIYLMSKINRIKAGKNQRKVSIFLSVLEFIADVVSGNFTSLGGLTVLMFIIGFFMTLVNFLVLINVVHVTGTTQWFGH